jgi:hypothetical protein
MGKVGGVSDPESLNRYLKDADDASKVMNFRVYVPTGFGKLEWATLPNLEETSDPTKVFTAEFPDESWRI